MYTRKCIRLNVRAVLCIILGIFLNGIHYSNTEINTMDVSTKGMYKNTTASLTKIQQHIDITNCPLDVACNQLPHICLNCVFNNSCIYGMDVLISCVVQPDVMCNGNREFQRFMNCRYCWQTEKWEQICVQNENCNSADNFYISNCSVKQSIMCLGNRTFQKKLRCNWTRGYKWSTALLLSITFGGFGVDRFYLGHWQEGIGKLFSFGGLGVWTLIDVILISLHYLGPADGSLYL